MASLYRQPKSSFWWIKWRDPRLNKVIRFSTGLRSDDPDQNRQAVQLKHNYCIKELDHSNHDKFAFHLWVEIYLRQRHANSPKTLIRNLGSWKTIASYFDANKIRSPSQVLREHVLGYVGWRMSIPMLKGKRRLKITRNTAILEVKVFSKIMSEAVRRKMIDHNPCFRLELKKDPSREKEEMSDEQINLIRQRIQERLNAAHTDEEKRNANFYHVSFEIARLQGIRLTGTWMPLRNIDIEKLEITYLDKGGKMAITPLNPALVPLIQSLARKRLKYTYVMPRNPSLLWFKFFDALRLEYPSFRNVSFHSTRVTVITRMERAGAQEKVTMKLVNHGSTTVHRVYRKVRPSEVAPYWAAVSSDTHPGAENQDVPPARPAPRHASSAAQQ